jgi:hypothetical protein
MAKTFIGTYTLGQSLTNPATQNPATVTATGFIDDTSTTAPTALFGTAGFAWTVTNLGIIESLVSNGQGVALQSGGTLTNSGTISTTGTNGSGVNFGGGGVITNASTGLISGYHVGIGFFPATATSAGPLTVVNSGTVISTQTGTAAATGFTGWAVQFGTSATGAITNFGSILGSETNGGGAVLMQDGGSVTNEAGGLISAATTGVDITGGVGIVTNFGTIASTATTGTAGQAVVLSSGGTITNYGLIIGARPPVTVGTAAGHAGVITTNTVSATVFNFGTITSGTGSTSQAINLLHGGVIVNGATNDTGALISGSNAGIYAGGHLLSTGVDYFYPGAGTTVTNYGTIKGSASGVAIVSGGVVTNRGLITGDNSGIVFEGSAGTVINFGTVLSTPTGTSGDAIYFNAGGTITNYGLISGARGPIAEGTALSRAGVVSTETVSATVRNFGTITSVAGTQTNGVNLLHGGVLVNGATNLTGALISGLNSGVSGGGHILSTGVQYYYPGAVTTVTNYGMIQASGAFGVRVESGGAVVNFGTISSSAPLSGTTGVGVYMNTGGLVINEAGGLITALRDAVRFDETAGTTISFGGVVNAGIIQSTGTGSGVYFGQGGVLINEAGGQILANGSAVEVKSGAGAIVNFGTITGASGTAIVLGGGDEVVLEAGSKLNGVVSNFQFGDTFDLPSMTFSTVGSATLGANNVLQIIEGATSAASSSASIYDIDLDPSQDFSGVSFQLSNDGTGGVLVSETRAAASAPPPGNPLVALPDQTVAGSVGSGMTTIVGAIGDTIAGGKGSDLINAVAGSASITGGTGSTTVWGGAGDTITGSSGTLLVDGTAGDQQIGGGSGASTILGGAGDTISGSSGSGSSVIVGASGDTVIAGSGDDLINALAGSQAIFGGSGNATVWGGPGDTIIGGQGNLSVDIDNVHFPGAVYVGDNGINGATTVTGFSQIAGDRLFFSNETTTAINTVIASAQTSGGNTLITLPDGATMTLIGITRIDSTFFR